MLENPGATILCTRGLGIELRAVNGRLQARMVSGGKVPEGWRELFKRHEKELVEYLEAPDVAALIQVFEAKIGQATLCTAD